jgi:hypothetical protein
MQKPVQFARPARKHRIGRAHALAAMEEAGEPIFVPATEKYGDQWYWRGRDDRGVELEIVAVEKSDCLLVIHVKPTSYEHQE